MAPSGLTQSLKCIPGPPRRFLNLETGLKIVNMGQSIDLIYLSRPDGTEAGPSTEWIYYRVTHGGDEDQGDGLFAVSKVSFPGCVDLSDGPGELATITPARIGYESVEVNLHKLLLNRYGVDHEKSILIGTLDSSPIRASQLAKPTKRNSPSSNAVTAYLLPGKGTNFRVNRYHVTVSSL
jgi:hypothetical protein